jgi:hypothetical protein
MISLNQATKEIRKSITSQRVQDATTSLTKSIKGELDQMYFGASPAPAVPAK